MNFNQLGVAFSLAFFLIQGDVHAAGAPVNEDFSLVLTLCDDMLVMAQKGNQDGFIELADAALKLSEAMRRDNSMAIDRFRPKLRAAKKAGKSGNLDAAVGFVEEAKILMKPASATWDGGS
ncbi:hypothetical protein [Methyloglobulus sp.]|uniref:hypothetical protein n=1 Tax=Methyloglobulus sp. TaxID=2518622 RepID=UPI0032B81002